MATRELLGYDISMKAVALLAVCVIAAPSISMAGDFATCLLDKLPGVQNDPAAHAAWQVCLSKHPAGMVGVKQGSGRGFFSFGSGSQCTLKTAGDTRSGRAAAMVGVACRKLYDEPNFFDQFDPSTARPAN